MKLKIITCKVLMRELYACAAISDNLVDIRLLKQSLHLEPAKLKDTLQAAITDTDNEDEVYDAICLGYGLCSNGIVGVSSQKYPIVIPRAHDCISLLLGSKERYNELFNGSNGGVYWYSPGWIESGSQPGEEKYNNLLEEYTQKYGEDNAQYLIDFEKNSLKEYTTAAYVKSQIVDNKKYIDYTNKCAQYLNWNVAIHDGSLSLLSAMVDGQWDEKKFLIVPAGNSAKPSYDEDVIKCDCPNGCT